MTIVADVHGYQHTVTGIAISL